MIPGRSSKPVSQPQVSAQSSALTPPDLDPAGRSRQRKENEPDQAKYAHPEHIDPETYKPEFGRLHKPKRVDNPPDNQNHRALSEKARQRD
ncbi:hypothetical protein F4808DRAFT_416294 [Astrocystis sublimbata]|nr:hypothetical protein F4808DRAFT_416294 [Astrocystis sublimbata]